VGGGVVRAALPGGLLNDGIGLAGGRGRAGPVAAAVEDLNQAEQQGGAELRKQVGIGQALLEGGAVGVGQATGEHLGQSGMREGITRLKAQGGPVGGLGLVPLAHRLVQVAQPQLRLGQVRLQLEGRAEVLLRLGHPSFFLKPACQPQVAGGPPGVDGQDALPAGKCRRGLGEVPVRVGPVLPVVSIAFVQLGGPLQPGQGLAEPALAPQQQPEVGVGRGKGRRQAHGLQVSGTGLDQLADSLQGLAEVVVQDGDIRTQAHRLAAMRERLGRPPLLQQRPAQVGLRRGEVRVQRDRLPEVLQGFVGPA
jgi:hypothetical protein